MRTFLLFLFIIFPVSVAMAQYTATVNATGAVGSYKTGYTSNGSGRTDGDMTISVNTIRGYAVFDLAGIVPPGATVTSATLRFTYTTTGTGTGVTCNIYGYPGDLSTITNATTLYSSCSTATVCNTGNWGASTTGTTVTRTLAAAGNTFLAAQAGNKISLCFVTSSSSNQYTITGEGGSAATIPQLVITYTCAGLSAATATTSSSTLCTGATLSLTGTVTGATTYSWSGPNSFSRTIQNPSLSVVPASAGNYTFTATNSAGCYYKAVTTPSVTVNALPTIAVITPSSTSLFIGSTLTLTAGTKTGTGTFISYNWSGPAGYNNTGTATTASFVPTTSAASGYYSLSVTYAGAGCTSTVVATSSSVTVNAPPNIISVSPNTGNPGTTITLTGTNFNPVAANNVVFFGAVKANVTAASATSLTVTSPVGSIYATLSVLNSATGLTGYEQYPFLPTFNNASYVADTFNFNPKVSLATGIDPNGMCIGDIDGDGKPDLVVCNDSPAAKISVYRNISTIGSITGASFEAAVSFNLKNIGTSVNAHLQIADIDGDGKLDIAVSVGLGDTFYVFHNTSTPGTINTGSFTKIDIVQFGFRSSDIAFADFDSDGKLDMAVCGSVSTLSGTVKNLGLYRNIGSPGTISFATPVNCIADTSFTRIYAGDLDGDGKPDIAALNQEQGKIAVFHNAAVAGVIDSTSFATQVNFNVNSSPRCITAADIDGDSKPELLTGYYGFTALSVLRNTATPGTINAGSFSPKVDYPGSRTLDLAVADFDGNGKPDILLSCTDSIITFRNVASIGSITTSSLARMAVATQVSINSYSAGFAAGDMDGDGKPDIVFTSYLNDNVSIMRNNPFLPLAAITGTTTVCVSSNTTLSNATPGGYWRSSNTSVATVSNTGVVTPVSVGTTTISYTIYSGYDTTNATRVVSVNALPTIAGITSSVSTVCTGTSFSLSAGTKTGTGSFTSYNWSGPNGYSATGTSTSTVLTPTATAASGLYSLTVTYQGVGCTSAAAVTSSPVTVNVRPSVASIAPSATTICTGSSLTLTAGSVTGTGTLTSYNWTGPASYNTSGIAPTAVRTPTNTTAGGVYSLSVTYPGTGCTSPVVTTSPSVTVNNRPTIASITPSSTTLCTGALLTLTAGTKTGTGTFLSYNWSGPNGYNTTGTSTNAVLTPTTTAATGLYSLSVTYPGAGCTSALVATSPSVTVNDQPTIANITPSTNTLCAGTSVTLTAGVVAGTGTLTSYNWTGPAGYSATGTSNYIVYTPTATAASGNYSVSVTYPGTGCTSLLAVTSPSVAVGALPTIAGITPSTGTVCTGTPLTLTAGTVTGTGSLISYNWSGPNGYNTTGTSTNAALTPTTTAASGNYSVSVTYPGTGCTSALAVMSPSVAVRDLPTVAGIASSTNTICTGSPLTLTAGTVTGSGSLTSYNWTGPGGYSVTGTSVTAVRTPTNTTASGNYSLSVTYPGTGCTSAFVTTSPSVTVNDRPTVADITPSTTTICTGNQLTLTAGAVTGTGILTSYNWTGPGSYSASGTVATAVRTPTNTTAGGTYSLSVTYPGNGCTSPIVTTSPSVTVNNRPTIAGITPSSTSLATGSTLTLTAGTISGSGTLTSYNWSGPAGYAATGTTATTSFVAATTSASGYYSLSVTYPGAGCTSTVVATTSSVTVNDLTTVTSVSPNAGNPGTAITITGTNFNTVPANNTVFFGAVKANVTAASATSLTVTSPVSSIYAPISVLNIVTGLMAYEQYPFLPTFNNASYVPDTFNFNPKVSLATGINPNGMCIGDIDGDGKPDIVVCSDSPTLKISVYRNISTPGSITGASFEAAVNFSLKSFPVGSSVSANLHIADIDGDGKPDIGVAASDTFYIFRNTSTPGIINTGSFTKIAIISSQFRPQDIAFADFDNDGKPDIAACGMSGQVGVSHNLYIYRNIGSPGTISFATPVNYNADTFFSRIYAGDLDGDGKPDIAALNQAQGKISVFRNTTIAGVIDSTSFAAQVNFNTNSAPRCITAADIDGDGKPELLTGYYGFTALSVLRNTATPGTINAASFSPKVDYIGRNTLDIAIADFDGNGKPDVLLSCGDSIISFRNVASAGTITTSSLARMAVATQNSINSYSSSFAAGDMDGDGKPDIVFTSYFNDNVSIMRNNPFLPLAAITGTTAVCGSSNTTLSNATPGGYWRSTNTSVATVSNTGIVTPVSVGTTTISYTINAGYDTTSTTRAVSVNALPTIASITPSTNTVCTGKSFSLSAGTKTGTGTFTSYNWSGPNGYNATGTSINATLTPTTTAASGVYSLNVTYQGVGCTSTGVIISSSVTVNARPSVASITPSSTTVCTSSLLTLTAGAVTGTDTLTSYNWTGPGSYSTSGTTITAVRIPTSTAAGGVYSLSVTYPGSGCTSPVVTTSPSVTVNNRPTIASITPSPTTLCTGALLTLTAGTKTGTGTFLSYNWSGPDSYSATTTGTTSVFTPTNVASTGTYSLSVTYAGSGCTSTVTTTPTVTVNALPTIASITPSDTTLCTGNALTLTAGAVTGPGTLTSYNWSGPNSFSSSGTSAIKVFTPAVIAASGVYSLTVTYPGSGCRSTAAITSPSVTVNTVPVVGIIAGSTLACIGNSITLSDTTGGGVWSSSNPAVATIYSGIVTGLASGTSVISYSVTNGCGTTVASVPFNVGAMEWQGTTSTDWNTASNWSCGAVPNVTGDVFIPVTSSQPVIGLSCDVKDIFITSGALLTVNGGAAMHVKGHMTNNSIVSGNGTVILDGSTAQTIDGQGIVDNLELDNTGGATISGGGRVTINKTLTITNGTFNTGDSLILASNDTSGSAYIAPIASGAGITGNVQIRQYVQGGYRRYRFMSHPFSTPISLGQLQNSIDITGTGGAANGFTTTGSNAASAFRYDPYTSNSTLSYDAGWKPYTDISSVAADTNKFNRYQGIRLFLRGSKGEGLGYWFTYTPSPTIIGMAGPVNQGDQTITLSKGSGTVAGAPVQDYNMVGNPYPSPVDIGTVLYNALIANQIVGAAFYVWNPSIGASGQFQAIPVSTVSAAPYYIQANTAFQVRAHHDGAALNFTENNKSANATSYLFKAHNDNLSLMVYDVNYHPWDMLTVKFNDEATEADDNYLDAVKPSGSDFNFYSLSSDNKKMVIDSRRYDADRVVPLGISTAYTQEFIIKAESVSKEQVYLHDKLLEKYVLLEAGTEYRFTTTKDKSTQGENRFELSMKPATATDVKGLQVTMTPNPATDEVKIKITSAKASNVNVRVLDMSGVNVYNENLGSLQSGVMAIPLHKLASGIYMVELSCGDEKVVQRLVKE